MVERTEAYVREKLYEEAWTDPALVVAKRHGVSNVALAKACRKLSVPLPPRGYWAKSQASRTAFPRPPLPPYDPSPSIRTRRSARDGSAGTAGPTVGTPDTRDAPSGRSGKTADKPKERKRATTWPNEATEFLHGAIEYWQRTFHFGVNRIPVLKGLLEKEGSFNEWDTLKVFGVVRHHKTFTRKRKRTGQKMELRVLPLHAPRQDWRDDPEGIGEMESREGKLFGVCHVPADVYYSLFPCLEANRFGELEIRIQGTRYRHGNIDAIEFSPKETSMKDLPE